MQVDRKGIGDLGVALHHNADRLLFPHRSLRRQHRAGPAERDRQHRPRKQHHAAHRHDDQRIRRQWRRRRGAEGSLRRLLRRQPFEASDFCSVMSRRAVGSRSMNGAVAAGRQTNAPFESALRQLETVDDRGPHLRRIGPISRDQQFALIDERLDLVEVDPGQSDQHQHRALGLENVDRRLPGDRRRGAGRLEKLPMHALRARQHLEGFRPHPVTRKLCLHRLTRPAAPVSIPQRQSSIAQFRPEFIRALGAPSSPAVSWALQLRILNHAGADSKRSGSLIRRTAVRRRVFVPWIR